MAGRFKLSTLADAVSNLPGPMKWVGGVLGLAPVLFMVVGIGWAGYQTPGKLNAHNAMTDTLRVEQSIGRREQASRDTAMLGELHETNRLLRCSLTNTSELARARCAAQRDE